MMRFKKQEVVHSRVENSSPRDNNISDSALPPID